MKVLRLAMDKDKDIDDIDIKHGGGIGSELGL